MIYHITTTEDWERNKGLNEFFPADYAKEGFIHCCTKQQLEGVLHRYFKGKTNLVLLHLDEAKLISELKYELSTGNERFPHLYGAINSEAIVDITFM